MNETSKARACNARARVVGRAAIIMGAGLMAVAPGIAHAVQTVPNPQGSLLIRADLSIPADPFPNSVFLGSDMDNPDLLGGDDLCEMDGGYDDNDPGEAHPFVTDTIQILKAGTYTFRVVNSTGIYDPFLALYSGTFDKSNPDDGVLGCNDDITNNDGYENYEDGDAFDSNGYDNYAYPELDIYWSLFEVDLEPGTYTIMLATYDDYTTNDGWYNDNGDFGTGSIGPLSNYTGKATSTFEYWGPVAGIQGGVGAENSPYDMDGYVDYQTQRSDELPGSGLPNTGASTTTLNLVVAFGFLGVGSTLLVVSRRRRFS